MRAGVLGRLALRVVEVRRDRDHGLGDFLAEVVLGGLLHLAQDFGRHLLRRDLLAAHFDPGVAVVGLDDLVGHQVDVLLHFLLLELAADQPLDRVDRVLRVGDRLPLRRRADEDLAVVLVRDDRRRRARAFEFSMTFGVPPSMMATQLLVVPRSMPMISPAMFQPPRSEMRMNAKRLCSAMVDFRAARRNPNQENPTGEPNFGETQPETSRQPRYPPLSLSLAGHSTRDATRGRLTAIAPLWRPSTTVLGGWSERPSLHRLESRCGSNFRPTRI